MKPLYIFDLDGTLALIEHRRHFVEGPTKNWRAFFAACVDDKPNLPVIETLKAIRKSADVWIWSGRSDEVQKETLSWLYKNEIFDPYWNPLTSIEQLQMREAGDYRDDVELKFSWLRDLSLTDHKRLVAVFDDRQKVVDMWRNNGVACFQVAPGNF